MEDVKELKEVLGRIEAKIIAAGKMYAAMNFAVWMSVMLLFYVTIFVVNLPAWGIILYWVTAGSVALWFTGKILNRLKALIRASGKKEKTSRSEILLIFAIWVTAIIVGWILIPQTSIAINQGARGAVGFLTFISMAIFAMWLFFARSGEIEREMIPGFILPALGIPVVWNMAKFAMIWGGFLVALGFTLTILWYLYSAFKRIG